MGSRGTALTVAEVLRRAPLFAQLGNAEIDRLARAVRRERLPQGTAVFLEGDPGVAMYLIASGKVRISKQLPGVGEEALAILGAGAVFGEMAVLDRTQRSASALVHEDAELLVLDAVTFESLIDDDPAFGCRLLRAMNRTLAGRLRDTTEKLMTVFVMAQFC